MAGVGVEGRRCFGVGRGAEGESFGIEFVGCGRCGSVVFGVVRGFGLGSRAEGKGCGVELVGFCEFGFLSLDLV